MNEIPKYEIFISYRRDGGVDYARMIYLELKGRGYNTFFDYNSLRDGKFNDGIFKAIDECRYFILVLSTGALDRCLSEDDWVRHEIEYALSKGKSIIPVCPSGSVRGFPAKMPASFEPLRNLQISMLQMDDLFEKSFDKIVEDRFDVEFREGRSPASSVSGVSNRSFTKVGIGIVVAILVAAAAVTFAIVNLDRESKDGAQQGLPGMVSVKNDSKDGCDLLSAIDMGRAVNRQLVLLRQNGWNTAESDYVKASSLYEQAQRDLGGRFVDAEKKFSEAGRICAALIGKLAARKLAEVDGKVAELELQGDRVLQKKLELINEILPIDPDNKDVLAAKQKVEDVLHPRMTVSVVCEGKSVPAEFTLNVPVLKLDGPCRFCKKKGKKSLDKDCMFCQQRPQGRKWLEVYHGRGSSYYGDEILLPIGTKFRAPKEIRATKGDVLGSVEVQYVREDGMAFSSMTGRIVANWVGETNVVLELRAKEQIAPGTVRVVPLPRCSQLEFVWCPAGSVEFEYREPVSGQLKQGRLSVNKGFWISKFEVTCAQAQVENAETSPARMSSREACRFARKIQNMIGDGAAVRLPTASEWEIAARYGNQQLSESNVADYAWLDEPGEGPGNHMDKSFREWRFHAVGEKKPNELGLYDMFGNMEEWAVGTIDSTLGLRIKSSWISKCDHCGKEMVVRGGSVRTSVTNALSILTRDYAAGRLSTLDWSYYCDNQCKDEDRWGMDRANVAVRLVADDLPSSEEMLKRFGGRHWLCENCGQFMINMAEPGKEGCKEGSHKWNWLEDVGEQKFKCKNCGRELMTRGFPRSVYARIRICPGPADKPPKKDFRGRKETYMHEWEKVR